MQMRKIITDVAKGSPLYKKGVRAGDEAVTLNGQSAFDIIDYLLATAEDTYKLQIKNDKKPLREICVHTTAEPPGASFEHITIDAPRHCLNNCVFCFMDQMPAGMRDTLYFKDDDYRLSFISGNYVTLTNANDAALERIARLKLSPMNISVHTTNPALRAHMMKNPNGAGIMRQLRFLADNKISLNLQLVLCPGLNDGAELARTMEDILGLGGAVNSLSCVPVGLTKYRDKLTVLKAFDRESAARVIETISAFKHKAKDGQTFCASDEFFILAGEKVPESPYYGAYDQYENGVGMLRSFADDIDEALDSNEYNDVGLCATLVTGKLAANFMAAQAEKINAHTRCALRVCAVENNFFGTSITVAGLVTGSDIVSDERLKNETLIIPSNMLKSDRDVFLDDTDIAFIEKNLHAKCIVSPHDGAGLMETLKYYGEQNA